MCSRALKWLLALLLPLTLAWKVIVAYENENDLASEITKVLSNHAFDVVQTDWMMESMPIIQATSGSCRVLVAKIAPNGSNANLIRNFATSTDQVFVVFRGKLYAEPPVLLIMTNYLLSKSLRKLGFVRRVPPVIAAVVSASCNIEQLPWGMFT